jgi:hypothetical protein
VPTSTQKKQSQPTEIITEPVIEENNQEGGVEGGEIVQEEIPAQ